MRKLSQNSDGCAHDRRLHADFHFQFFSFRVGLLLFYFNITPQSQVLLRRFPL